MNKQQYISKLCEIKGIARIGGFLLVDLDLWAQQNKEAFKNLINYKFENIPSEAIKSNGLILATPQFNDYSEQEQYLIMHIIIDIENLDKSKKTKEYYTMRYEPYHKAQKLYSQLPKLTGFFREPQGKEELIDYSKISKYYDAGGYFKANNLYFRFYQYPYAVISTMMHDYGNKGHKLFLRLEHNFCENKRGITPVQESLIRPPNPKWVENMTIYGAEGAAYDLTETNDDEIDLEKRAWKTVDYFNGVRKFEVIAKRNNEGHFSMMIEELVKLDEDIILGNCIHCDSNVDAGTNCSNVILSHIDFAENIYIGERARERMGARLDKGKVPDATIRGHLFRLEGIPFLEVPKIAYICCRSKLLVEDWIKAQFKQ